MSTAGTTISTELKKKGFSPLQSTPVQAWLQAFAQAASPAALGSERRFPSRTSAMSFSDVVTITYRGTRKKAAKSSRTDQRAKRCQAHLAEAAVRPESQGFEAGASVGSEISRLTLTCAPSARPELGIQ